MEQETIMEDIEVENESEEEEEVEEEVESEESNLLNGIGTQDSFSAKSGSGGSHSWNHSKIEEVIKRLKSEDDGSVRVIPLSWIQSNLRNVNKTIVWAGWSSRLQFIKASRILKIPVEIITSGCQKSTFESGQLEIKFN